MPEQKRLAACEAAWDLWVGMGLDNGEIMDVINDLDKLWISTMITTAIKEKETDNA